MPDTIGVLGLATGLPGFVEVCLRLGGILTSKLKAYQTADTKLQERLLAFSLKWDNQEDILKLLRDLDMRLSDDEKARLDTTIVQLRNTLLTANELLAKISTPPPNNPLHSMVRRLNYSVLNESALANLLDEAEALEETLTRRMVVLHIADQRATRSDRMLGLQSARTGSGQSIIPVLQSTAEEAHEIKLDSNQFPLDDHIPLERDDPLFRYSKLFRSKSHPGTLIEYYNYSISPRPDADVPELASKLYAANPTTMHILPCRGYTLRDGPDTRYELYFKIPTELRTMTPRNLRSVLLDPKSYGQYGPNIDLNSRLQLAKDLATAVLYVHSGGFVHKSIRPESVLVFIETEQPSHASFPYCIGPGFLTGFDSFRSERAAELSLRRGDHIPMNNLYRHPDRWHSDDIRSFTMLHDIFSLGVLMVEIGFWQSLIEYQSPTEGPRFIPGLDKVMATDDPHKVRAWLLKLARNTLPRAMGNGYSKIVLACLSGVEGAVSTSGDAADSDETSNVASTYLEDVIERLEKIKI